MSKKVLKIKEVVALSNAIEKARSKKEDDQTIGPLSLRFSYASMKVSKNIASIIAGVSEMEKLSPKYKDFQEKRIALCQKYCRKDATGNPVVSNNNFLFDVASPFHAEVKELTEEYKEEIAEREKVVQEVNAYFNEQQEEVDIHELDLDQFPSPCPIGILEALEPMIREVKD